MVDELRMLLERYGAWPHTPQGTSRAQTATYALATLKGAEQVVELRSADRLEAVAAVQGLPWDTARLGVESGRVAFVRADDAMPSHAELVRATLAHTSARGLRYLFTRVDAAELGLVQALEAAGFVTIDAILSLYCMVDGRPGGTPPPEIRVREGGKSDAGLLEHITDASIRFSRFHCDPWIGMARARELYREWARNSVDGLNDITLIAEIGSEPAGYLSCREFHGAREAFGWGYCRVELVAVLEKFRGRGVVPALVVRLLDECASHGWGRCGVGTQISNVGAIRAYTKAGFQPGDAILTLRWLDPTVGAR